MPDLILRFHDEALDAFDWVIAQGDVAVQSTAWHAGDESALAGLISAHLMPVIFVIPQQCILLTQFDLPGKASRQVLSSIEFQIEDRLGQDIELQHFAIGEVLNNSVAVAVVKKSIMQRCLSLQKNYGMTISKVIPELLLCPWPDNQRALSVIGSRHGLIVRFGFYQGFKCQPALLETMLDQLHRVEPLAAIHYFYSDEEPYQAISTDNYKVELNKLTLHHLNDPKIDSLDLRQREFKRSSVWGELIKPWRWAAVIFVTLLLMFAVNQFEYLNKLNRQLANIKHQQYQLIKDYLAAGTVETDDLKKQLIQVIKQNQANQQESDFISQLVIFTEISKQYSSIVISKIGFQQGRLSIDVTSTKLGDMEALLDLLQSSSLSAKMEDLTIKPEFVSGRLVLAGK